MLLKVGPPKRKISPPAGGTLRARARARADRI